MANQEVNVEPMDTEPVSPHQNQDNSNLNGEEQKEKKRNKSETNEKAKEHLTTSGNHFITTFGKMLVNSGLSREICSKYMQKVLHSIFFLGHVNVPRISPEEFLSDNMQTLYKNKFPKPFIECSTHLARQTPYSILLEFMQEIRDPENQDNFLKELAAVNKSLLKLDKNQGNQQVSNAFSATVTAYSCFTDAEDNQILKMAYGASMSCKGRDPRKIMISVSALVVWDKAISYAVFTEGNNPIIRFPNQVYCKAYRFSIEQNGFQNVAPCNKCAKIFPNVKFDPLHVKSEKDAGWPYGNCAETEALSKLILGYQEIRSEFQIETRDGEKMHINDIENTFKEVYEETLKRKLKMLLGSRSFKITGDNLPLFEPV
ncbi:uncharacterized protein RCH25_048993 [Pelodytes ibericus]